MAAKVKRGAIPLTEAQFAKELAKRLGLDLGSDAKNLAESKRIIGAFKDEVVDCVRNGYKVTFNGFGRFEPKYVPEKKATDMIRDPSTGEQRKRGKSEPSSFKVKAFMSSALSKAFPSTRTNAGKQLAEALAPPAPKAKSAKGK